MNKKIKNKKTFIVKCQKSIATTASKKQILVYNKSRSILFQESTNKYWNDWFKKCGNPFKFYAEAHMEGTILCIDCITSDQNW